MSTALVARVLEFSEVNARRQRLLKVWLYRGGWSEVIFERDLSQYYQSSYWRDSVCVMGSHWFYQGSYIIVYVLCISLLFLDSRYAVIVRQLVFVIGALTVC